MNVEEVFALVIMLFVAMIMVIIGIVQINSKSPVGFYTSDKPEDFQDITDVSGWNKRHGCMWVLYGIVIIAGYLVGLLIDDNILSSIPSAGGVVLPIPFMMVYHHFLIRKYKNHGEEI